MEIIEAIKARRAVKQFDETHVIPQKDLDALLDAVQLAPSSFNIQHTRFVMVEDKTKRAAIKEAAWNQAQITDASALFILCGDVKAWDKNPERYWKNAPKESQDILIPMLRNFYDGREWIQRDEVLRSVGLSAQTLMLAAQGLGYDSCPMIGFDQDAVAKIINLPDDHIIGMIITVGKAKAAAHPRGGLLDRTEILIKNNF